MNAPTAKGATHCDNCGLTWLDDGLNPIGCPYCKPPKLPERAKRDCTCEACEAFTNGWNACLDAANEALEAKDRHA